MSSTIVVNHVPMIFLWKKNILCSIVLLVESSHLVGSVPGDVPGISRVDETT